MNNTISNLILKIGLICFVIMIFICILSIFLSKKFALPLEKGVNYIRSIIPENLLKRDNINSPDETRMIINSFKKVYADLNKVRNKYLLLFNIRKKLARKLMISEERERERIAGILHDNIGPLLSLSVIKISMLKEYKKGDKIKNDLDYINNNINDALTIMRSLTQDLSLCVLKKFGINKALTFLLHDVKLMFGIDCRLNYEPEQEVITDIYQTIIYKFINELVNNVIKHAKAHFLSIDIRKNGKYFHIDVQDDGIGLENSQVKKNEGEEKCFGLFSMREKLDYLNGKMTIHSKSNKGTTVMIELPIEYLSTDGKEIKYVS